MEFLRSLLRSHFEGKPLVTSRNVGCFLRLRFLRAMIFSTIFFVHLKNMLFVSVFYKLFANAFVQCKTQLNQSNSIAFFLRPGVGRVN